MFALLIIWRIVVGVIRRSRVESASGWVVVVVLVVVVVS